MKKLRTKLLLKAVRKLCDYIDGCMNHGIHTSLSHSELKATFNGLGRIEDDLIDELGIEQ